MWVINLSLLINGKVEWLGLYFLIIGIFFLFPAYSIMQPFPFWNYIRLAVAPLTAKLFGIVKI